MSKLPDPRKIVLDKEVNVSNGIKGHQHREKNQLKKNILRFMIWRFDMYFPAFIVFVITLIPLFFTKLLFIADWERPKDLNGIDARVIIFWGYVFGMVLPIGLVAFRGYII